MKIAMILEAAGNSTRFGSNKLLYTLTDGRPMIMCIIDSVRALVFEYRNKAARDAEMTPVLAPVIVTQYEEIAAMAPDFSSVINHHPEFGISHSMKLGIEASKDADAFMFCVCDQPWLTKDTLALMIDTYTGLTSRDFSPIVSLAWEDRMYNPKIFSSKYQDELLALTGDIGGRQIIKSHTDSLVLVSASSAKEVSDIDTTLQL